MTLSNEQKIAIKRLEGTLMGAIAGILNAQTSPLRDIGLGLEAFSLDLVFIPIEQPAAARMESDEHFLRFLGIVPDLKISETERR